MAELLDRNPRKNEKESELDRLARLALKLNGKGQNNDLGEAIACILEFESCYRLVSLAFERLLWLCRHHSAASVKFCEVKGDPILQSVMGCVRKSARRFLAVINTGNEPAFRQGIESLSDVATLLQVGGAATTTEGLIRVLIDRHTQVQHGKFDRGRRKCPGLRRMGRELI